MSRFTADTFNTGSIASGSSVMFNRTVVNNQVNVGKIKVVPSASTLGYVIEIFKKATGLSADKQFSTISAVTGTFNAPTSRNGGEVLEGFIIPYEDLDGTFKLHVKVTNLDPVSRSYDVLISYESAPTISNVLHGVRYADLFAGSSASDKITAAIADLVSAGTGGVVNCWGLEGAQTLTSTVLIPANVIVLLGSSTYTVNFAGIAFKLQGRGAKLIGLGWDATVLLMNATSAPFTCVRIEEDGFLLKDFRISGLVPAGQEGGGLSAINFFKTLQLKDGMIDKLWITGTNAGIYVNALTPAGVKNLTITDCRIKTLHIGISIGPFEFGIVNDTVRVLRNDLSVTAMGGYTGFEFARPLQVLNGNDMWIKDNKSIGGFNACEVLGNIGNPSTGRPHMRNVTVTGNHCDSFMTIAQCDDSDHHGNTVDMRLRDPDGEGWPVYEDATGIWGYPPAIEAADLLNSVIGPNTLYGPIGPGYDFGLCTGCTLYVGSIKKTGNTATPDVTRASGIVLDYAITDSKIIGGTIDEVKTHGISQIVASGYIVSRLGIEGVTIRNAQRHGVLISNTVGVTLDGCEVYHPNLAAGAYDAYHFEGSAIGDQISGLLVKGNKSDGGRYGIFHNNLDSGANRLSMVEGNLCVNATTRAFKIQCRRRNNSDGTALTAALGLSSGHLDGSVGLDYVVLDPGAAANLQYIDNMTEGDEILILLARADTTVKHNASILLLAGSADLVTPAALSVIRLLCVNSNNPVAEVYVEIARSIR